jgi:hypothetical protein
MKNRRFFLTIIIFWFQVYSSKNNSHVDSENQIQFQVTWTRTSD